MDEIFEYLMSRYCQGRGAEIGPGKHPRCDPDRTTFVDGHKENADAADNPDVVADASFLPFKDGQLDYLFSSHCLEHVPNTLKALLEWIRVVKVGGFIFLMLPHCERIFDRYRAKTTLQHHIDDFANLKHGIPDHSHDEEIMAGWKKLEHFDSQKNDFEAKWKFSMWDFDSRISNGVMHYHVWTQNEIVTIFQYLGLQVVFVLEELPSRNDSFIVIGRKVG